MPRSRIKSFLAVLHEKLAPGAFVLFADQLPYAWERRRRDEEGNLLEERSLSDRRTFEIVKNLPTEKEIASDLARLAERVTYREYPEAGYWTVSYHSKSAH